MSPKTEIKVLEDIIGDVRYPETTRENAKKVLAILKEKFGEAVESQKVSS